MHLKKKQKKTTDYISNDNIVQQASKVIKIPNLRI